MKLRFGPVQEIYTLRCIRHRDRERRMIGPQQPDKDKRKQWESAHVCPQCEFPIELRNIGLAETTTGLITCPKCDWSGQIAIEIIEKKPRE